jgi:hypothetical protein
MQRNCVDLRMYDVKSTMAITRFPVRKRGQEIYCFESFTSLMRVTGSVLIFLQFMIWIFNQDKSQAFMTSIISEQEICVNLTCGGLYCSFKQPKGCDATPKFLHTYEIAEFCSPSEVGCDWSTEVLTTSEYANWTQSVFIYNTDNGLSTFFPPLEGMKQQSVDITKYTDSRSTTPIVQWNIQTRLDSSQMKSCGSNVGPDQRCGSYIIYLSKTVWDETAQLRYSLIVTILVLGGMAVLFSFNMWLAQVTRLYRWAYEFKKRIDPPHAD